MPIENIEELEKKIDSIITVVQELKSEKKRLSAQIEEQTAKIESLEAEKSNLNGKISSAEGSSDERQKKMELAALRIADLLVKLEAVEK